jgi:hypothetical protein
MTTEEEIRAAAMEFSKRPDQLAGDPERFVRALRLLDSCLEWGDEMSVDIESENTETAAEPKKFERLEEREQLTTCQPDLSRDDYLEVRGFLEDQKLVRGIKVYLSLEGGRRLKVEAARRCMSLEKYLSWSLDRMAANFPG